ncbi:unnamed protein product [Mycena citricolor]|uniref:Uncharacterized protein n=1 Tax=Mycena citricolor TaxID=2018698 RepID=A0AAD2Q7X4_9AGAR|nr:unnamed protein product [Mycena citricolor]
MMTTEQKEALEAQRKERHRILKERAASMLRRASAASAIAALDLPSSSLPLHSASSLNSRDQSIDSASSRQDPPSSDEDEVVPSPSSVPAGQTQDLPLPDGGRPRRHATRIANAIVLDKDDDGMDSGDSADEYRSPRELEEIKQAKLAELQQRRQLPDEYCPQPQRNSTPPAEMAVNEGGGTMDGGSVVKQYRRGPRPQAFKDEARGIRQEFDRNVEALAAKYNYPLATARGEVLGEPKKERKKNNWNLFQSFYSNKIMPKPDNVKITDWTRDTVRPEYKSRLQSLPSDQREDPEALEELFADMYKWFEGALEGAVVQLRQDGKFGKMGIKAARELSKLAQNIFERLGLHGFGVLIDADGQASCHWGGSPLYLELLKKYKPAMFLQLKDYEAMVRMILLERQGLSSNILRIRSAASDDDGDDGEEDEEADPKGKGKNPDSRDSGRARFSMFMRQEVSDVLLTDMKTVNWTWNLSEMAYRYKIISMNWPEGFALPKTGHWKASVPLLAKVLPPLEARWNTQLSDARDDDDADTLKRKEAQEEMASNAIYCELWTEEQKAADDVTLGKMPVVLSLKGDVLALLGDSPKFKKDKAARVEAAKRAEEKLFKKLREETLKRAKEAEKRVSDVRSPSPPTRAPAAPAPRPRAPTSNSSNAVASSSLSNSAHLPVPTVAATASSSSSGASLPNAAKARLAKLLGNATRDIAGPGEYLCRFWFSDTNQASATFVASAMRPRIPEDGPEEEDILQLGIQVYFEPGGWTHIDEVAIPAARHQARYADIIEKVLAEFVETD